MLAEFRVARDLNVRLLTSRMRSSCCRLWLSVLLSVPTSWYVPRKYQEIVFSKSAPVGRNGAPGDRGSFVEVSRALLCFSMLWGRFATDIPRASLLIINKLRNPKNPRKVLFRPDRYLITRRS